MHGRNMLRMIKHNTSVYEVFMAMNFKMHPSGRALFSHYTNQLESPTQHPQLARFQWTRLALEVCDLLIIG